MKKIMISLAAAALACAAFTGCQKKGAGEGDAARSAGGKIELEMYYYKQENQEGLMRIAKAFQKENPDISIKMLIIPNDADASMSARAAQKDCWLVFISIWRIGLTLRLMLSKLLMMQMCLL